MMSLMKIIVMKKIFVLIGIAILTVTSCVKSKTIEADNNIISIENVSQNSALLSDLYDYNVKCVSSNNPETRAGQKWLKFCAVVGADLIGAYEGFKIGGEAGATIGGIVGHPVEGAIIGAVVTGSVCGIGASYVAGVTISGSSMISNDILFDQLYASMIDSYPRIGEIKDSQLKKTPIAQLVLVPDKALEMGALHNELLSDLNPHCS